LDKKLRSLIERNLQDYSFHSFDDNHMVCYRRFGSNNFHFSYVPYNPTVPILHPWTIMGKSQLGQTML